MQRSKCKNANPKKVETRGFSRCPNPVFGFGKMSGLPGYPGFSKPGFQSLVSTLSLTTRSIFIRLAVASEICEIPLNFPKIRTNSSSRSSKVIDLGVIESTYATSYQ